MPAKWEFEHIAISNQVRQRNECYKQFVKGFTQTKEWEKDVFKWPKTVWNISFYYISNVRGLRKALES